MCETSKAEKPAKQIDSRFVCKKCGDIAHKEKHLCKPQKIENKKLKIQ